MTERFFPALSPAIAGALPKGEPYVSKGIRNPVPPWRRSPSCRVSERKRPRCGVFAKRSARRRELKDGAMLLRATTIRQHSPDLPDGPQLRAAMAIQQRRAKQKSTPRGAFLYWYRAGSPTRILTPEGRRKEPLRTALRSRQPAPDTPRRRRRTDRPQPQKQRHQTGRSRWCGCRSARRSLHRIHK